MTPYEFSSLVLYNKKNLETEYTLLRNTIYNAHINLNRKKGDKEIPLFEESKEENGINKDTLKSEREALFSEFKAR